MLYYRLIEDSQVEGRLYRNPAPFKAIVDQIMHGVDKPLPPAQEAVALTKVEKIDASMPHMFYIRLHQFVAQVYRNVDDEAISRDVKIEALDKIFDTEIAGKEESDNFDVTTLNLKIARIGAYVFVGASEADVTDPKAELPEVTALYRESQKLGLTDYERGILHKIAAGLEQEGAATAVTKLRQVIDALRQEIPEDRKLKIEDSLTPEFAKALLVADF